MTINNEKVYFKSVLCAVHLKEKHGVLTEICFFSKAGSTQREGEKLLQHMYLPLNIKNFTSCSESRRKSEIQADSLT